MKTILTAAALAALLAIPAVAQDTTTPDTKNAPAVEQPSIAPSSQGAKITTGELSASELLNETVVNEANESIGDVNDVLIDSKGSISAVIVGVGGFLGMGEKDVALTFDKLTFARENDNDLVVKANVTKDILQAAPAYTKPSAR